VAAGPPNHLAQSISPATTAGLICLSAFGPNPTWTGVGMAYFFFVVAFFLVVFFAVAIVCITSSLAVCGGLDRLGQLQPLVLPQLRHL
jgi:hypothetical protein